MGGSAARRGRAESQRPERDEETKTVTTAPAMKSATMQREKAAQKRRRTLPAWEAGRLEGAAEEGCI